MSGYSRHRRGGCPGRPRSSPRRGRAPSRRRSPKPVGRPRRCAARDGPAPGGDRRRWLWRPRGRQVRQRPPIDVMWSTGSITCSSHCCITSRAVYYRRNIAPTLRDVSASSATPGPYSPRSAASTSSAPPSLAAYSTEPQKLAVDRLIVATGSAQSHFGRDEFALRAPAVKTIEDALEVRGRILGAFVLAEPEKDAGSPSRPSQAGWFGLCGPLARRPLTLAESEGCHPGPTTPISKPVSDFGLSRMRLQAALPTPSALHGYGNGFAETGRRARPAFHGRATSASTAAGGTSGIPRCSSPYRWLPFAPRLHRAPRTRLPRPSRRRSR